MNISCDQYDHVAVINIDGELSADTFQVFQNTIEDNLKQGHACFVIYFEKISCLDSEGLEALLWLRDKCRENDGEVKLAGLDETQIRILHITRLDREFDIHPQIVEAVRSFQR